jgi:DNA-directed RNA polymerase specialized sigma24 family protein
MKYAYVTATGKQEIEVEERFHGILLAMDREEYNADRKHSRRRPLSLSQGGFDGSWMADKTDIPGELIGSEAVLGALSCLSPRQRYLVTKCCLEGWSYTALAAREDVTEGAIRHAVERAKKQMQKNLAPDRPGSGFAEAIG